MKKYPIVDSDVHPVVSSERRLDFMAEPFRTRHADGNRGVGGLGYWNPGGVMRKDAVLPDGTRIETDPKATASEFLDKFGIDYAVLMEADLHIALSPEPDFSAALVAATNDVLIEDWLTADPRYRMALMISLSDPHLAAKEIHRRGDHPGVVQVYMPSASPLPLGHRYFHPIFEAAVEHNLPIGIHPGGEGVDISRSATGAGIPSSYLEWHTVLSSYYMAQLVSLVTEGVFVKFPTLQFVLVEGGVSWLPPLMWRLDKNWKALRKTAPWLDRLPSEIIQEHVHMTTQPLEEPANSDHLRMIFEMFDAENMLMFSSDYPHWDGDTPDFAARMFPDHMKAKVLGGNAMKLYGLPEPEYA